MSHSNFSRSDVVSEIYIDEIKEARGLLAKGRVQECLALLEEIEDMMFFILAKGKAAGAKLQ